MDTGSKMLSIIAEKLLTKTVKRCKIKHDNYVL